MKSKMKTILGGMFAVVFASSASASEGFDNAKLAEVAKVLVNEFTTLNPAHVQHMSGYKIWKSGEEARAKVYVDHNGMNMEFNFLCRNVDTGLECSAQ